MRGSSRGSPQRLKPPSTRAVRRTQEWPSGIRGWMAAAIAGQARKASSVSYGSRSPTHGPQNPEHHSACSGVCRGPGAPAGHRQMMAGKERRKSLAGAAAWAAAGALLRRLRRGGRGTRSRSLSLK
eukprot:scaffold3223_cov115-Isochrysis_galbana.AAC.4